MKTEDLIAGLARDLTPVRRLASPWTRLLTWLALALPLLAAGVLVLGPRSNLARAVVDWRFLAVGAVAVATMVAAAAAALVLSVPGREVHARWRGTGVALTALWGALMLALVGLQGGVLAGAMRWPLPLCIVKVIGFAAVPAVLLVAMLRRAAPLRPAWTAGLAAVAALAGGALATQFVCPSNRAGHLLLAHYLPVVGFGLAGALLLRALVAPSRPSRVG
ncbi:MAG: NrsF family protein [Vicinamibacterales bacterium]